VAVGNAADVLGSLELLDLVEQLVVRLETADLARLLPDLLVVDGEAAVSYVVAAATTAPRALELVAPLVERGLDARALAVIAHAADLDTDVTRRWLDADDERRRQITRAAAVSGRADVSALLALA
jgi:hypothetical protein